MNKISSNAKDAQKEALAIVGIGCRFPGGANTPDAFWTLLRNGVDTLSDVPVGRWDPRKFMDSDREKPGTAINFQAGFLSEPIEEYDPAFFGISPREAAYIDPQQRILMELTWEAFEDAAIPVDQFRGENVGVYVGGFTVDSLLNQMNTLNRDTLSPHSATSASLGMLANRMSYLFDFRGPSITIDTACSSSLVALNYACRDLWEGECSIAVAAGVNAMLRPEFPIAMTKGGFLSSDSRSKAFDARANGYARGEGGGVVVLKRLSEAEADGDRVYATIRGIGVNQDGATSGITVPNPEAQEALIRKVYRDFDVDVADVAYVEAHGTGTPVGDPIEMTALGRTLGHHDSGSEDVLVGSVKANIGHQEAAAGIAATIKSALVLTKGEVPPQANFETPNPDIPFESLGLRVPVNLESLPERSGGQTISINSFGYGGTNAHAVLQAVPADSSLVFQAPRVAPVSAQQPLVLPISARDPNALSALAGRFADGISHAGEEGFEPYVAAMALRRAHSHERAAIVAASSQEAVARLRELAGGARAEGIAVARAPAVGTRPLTFVYTGMGPQWWGMGQQLYADNPVFKAAVDEADAAFQVHSGWSILAEMLSNEDVSRMARNEIAQPANFIIQVGLTAVWKSLGVTPQAVLGHSVGEVTAAYVAGALSLSDAALVSYHRSRCQQKMAGRGGMLAVGLGPEAAGDLADLYPGQISIAAINSPSSVALAGDMNALQEVSDILEEEDIFNRILKVEVAYHSHQMDPLEAELKEVLASLSPKIPQIPLWSSVTAEPVETALHDADYWWLNVRQDVRFADAMQAMCDSGEDLFLEVGPHPVLAPSIKENAMAVSAKVDVLHSLRRGQDEVATTHGTLAALYCHGADIDWTVRYGAACAHVAMPLYPWQRSYFWTESEENRHDRLGDGGDILLGTEQPTPTPSWQSKLTNTGAAYLDDHQVDGAVVFPGAGYTQIMQAAQAVHTPKTAGVLDNVRFLNAMVMGQGDRPMLRTEISADGRKITVHGSRAGQDGGWITCAEAQLSQAAPNLAVDALDIAHLQNTHGDRVDVETLYRSLAARRLSYGPAFRGLTALARNGNQFLARIEADASVDIPEDFGFVHPTMLDSAFQALIAGLDTEASEKLGESTFVPVEIRRLTLAAPVGRTAWCHGSVRMTSPTAVVGEIFLTDEDGRVLVHVEGFRAQALPRAEATAEGILDDAGYAYVWRAASPAVAEDIQGESWLILHDNDVLAEALQSEVQDRGATAEVATFGTQVTYAPSRVVVLGQRAAGGHPTGLDTCLAVLHLANDIGQREAAPQLTVVTGTGEGEDAAQQFGLAGLARVIGNEYPDLSCRLIDLAARPSSSMLRDLVSEISSAETGEDEVQLGADGRYLRRLTRVDLPRAERQEPIKMPATTPFELEFEKPGDINTARFVEVDRRAPEAGEVELRILSVSLNFKDILKMLGVLTDEVMEGTYCGRSLGMEAATEVMRVGEGVENYKVGDRMVGTLPNGCFCGYSTVAAKDIHTMPALPGHHLNDLAGAPIGYVTAYYGLRRVANLQAGERVLLHSATGGVGLAAIQVAQRVGAEIYATAGSEMKRAHLRALGVEHVYDSRSLNFADDIRRDTQGEGMDVVLNFLPGEAQQKSVGLLAPFGRFIEIGKRDIEENRGLELRDFNQNLQFSSIDIDRLVAQKPALFDALLQEVWKEFEAGSMTPVPINQFQISQLVEACHSMRRAEHIGKIVVTMDGETLPIVPKQSKESLFRADASYLVTGGLGGFGLRVAQWMAEQGAGTLVLASRSGAKTDDANAAVAALEAQGVKVLPLAVDVSNSDAVDRMMEVIRTQAAPLAGVFHAAAVLEDGLMQDMSDSQFASVMNAKAGGAWNLHRATRDLNLEQFVLFSSVSALVGNAGQANYAAANTFLDALAHLRRNQGLVGTSINWGALAEVGMAARDAKVEERLAQTGVKGLKPKIALEALGRVIRADMTQVGVMDVDWTRWRQTNPAAGRLHKFQELVSASDNSVAAQLSAELAEMEETSRKARITEMLKEGIADVLHLSADRVDASQQLSDMGIDSLMMVEVQLMVERDFGLEMSAMDLTRGGSVEGLAGDLVGRLIANTHSANTDMAPELAEAAE
ncbi:type I polyketide synthase [Shimia sediminis]|uniref:type I polyketide synthase n=1 Tax=Shimia sediminis TaxID=2497945 RepID=UPI000F8CD916|nr:type I polyketide synthase [Shimia sediminis]